MAQGENPLSGVEMGAVTRFNDGQASSFLGQDSKVDLLVNGQQLNALAPSETSDSKSWRAGQRVHIEGVRPGLRQAVDNIRRYLKPAAADELSHRVRRPPAEPVR